MSSRPRRGLPGLVVVLSLIVSAVVAAVFAVIDVAVVAVIVPHPITAIEALGLFAAVVGSSALIAATTGPARLHPGRISVKIARTGIGLLREVMATTSAAAQLPRNWGLVPLTDHPGTGSLGGGLLASERFWVGAACKHAPRSRPAPARRQVWDAASEPLPAVPGLVMAGA